MSKTSKWIIALIVIIIIVAGVWSYSSKPKVVPIGDKQTITIGATLPLTGNLAFLGVPYKNAMMMALESLQSDPNLKYNYKIVFEDDQFDPAQAVTTVNKLISVDKVDAVASFGSPTGSAISPITEQNKIVHFNGIASDPSVAVGDYNFVHWTPPYKEVSLLLSELNKRNLKNVVLFEQNQPGVLAVTNSLRSQVAGSGVNIISTQKFNGDEKDFRTLIQKAKSVTPKADIYLLEATSPQLEVLAKQISEAGIKAPLTSIEAFEFTDKPELFKGDWFVAAASQQQWFVDAYKAKYGSDPKLGSGNGYDVVNMLVSAFEGAGDAKTKPGEDNVRQALAGFSGLKGAMGDNLSIDKDGIVITQPLVKTVQ